MRAIPSARRYGVHDATTDRTIGGAAPDGVHRAPLPWPRLLGLAAVSRDRARRLGRDGDRIATGLRRVARHVPRGRPRLWRAAREATGGHMLADAAHRSHAAADGG